MLGGVDAAIRPPVADVERFDPATGAVHALATQLAARTGAAVVPIGTADAQLAVIGGIDPDRAAARVRRGDRCSTPAPPCVVSRVDDAQMARAELTATTLTDGTVVAIGGAPPGLPPTGDVDVVTLTGGVVR